MEVKVMRRKPGNFFESMRIVWVDAKRLCGLSCALRIDMPDEPSVCLQCVDALDFFFCYALDFRSPSLSRRAHESLKVERNLHVEHKYLANHVGIWSHIHSAEHVALLCWMYEILRSLTTSALRKMRLHDMLWLGTEQVVSGGVAASVALCCTSKQPIGTYWQLGNICQ